MFDWNDKILKINWLIVKQFLIEIKTQKKIVKIITQSNLIILWTKFSLIIMWGIWIFVELLQICLSLTGAIGPSQFHKKWRKRARYVGINFLICLPKMEYGKLQYHRILLRGKLLYDVRFIHLNYGTMHSLFYTNRFVLWM